VIPFFTFPSEINRRSVTITKYFADKRSEQRDCGMVRSSLLHRYASALRGSSFINKFANLWLGAFWNYPDSSSHDFFAAAGLFSADV
jgi:hypothetical protein